MRKGLKRDDRGVELSLVAGFFGITYRRKTQHDHCRQASAFAAIGEMENNQLLLIRGN